MKAPAFQFYVADYMQDTRMISLAARGAWMDLLCTMWRSPTRGQVTSTIIGYARLFGCTVEQAKAVIDELSDAQVCNSVTDADGKVTLSNRRMMREAKERENANFRQKKYAEKRRRGNDAASDAHNDAGMTAPSSSTSSSSSLKEEKPSLSERARDAQNFPPNDEVSAAEMIYRELTNVAPSNHDSTRLAVEVKNPDRWRRVVRRLLSNGTPPRNVGTMLDVYLEQEARTPPRADGLTALVMEGGLK